MHKEDIIILREQKNFSRKKHKIVNNRKEPAEMVLCDLSPICA